MLRLEFEELSIDQLITHQVGSPTQDEELLLSDQLTQVEENTFNYLLHYFLMPFQSEDLQQFFHPEDLHQNKIFGLIAQLFQDSSNMISVSQEIARFLYDNSLHPKIKSGALHVAYFSNIVFEDEVVDAVGIFKSENNVPFIRIIDQGESFSINHEYGFEVKGIDKGALILNTNEDDGYLVMVVDPKNRAGKAQFWKEQFLQVRPFVNNYHQTHQFMSLTKDYVTKQMTEEFPVQKTDQIDILNKSVNFFKEKESFNQSEFEEAVLGNEEMIDSFRKFGQEYQSEKNIQINEEFDISEQAVKKQSRVFKSVLKLDKNFHIYIHGNKDLIQFGKDDDGRKFYKIYFENEN